MDIFWVLVLQEPNKRYIVTLVSGIAEMLRKEPAENHLLYLRMFTSMQDAIGQKLFLQGLPASGLVAMIRSINPKQRDIRPVIEQFYDENSLKINT